MAKIMKAFEGSLFFAVYLYMHELNLPSFPLKIIKREGKRFVFDVFRKRYVVLSPEEWVRQNFLWWLKTHKGFPASLMVVEASLQYNRMPRRADAIVYGHKRKPVMIIECKSAEQKITQDVFDQVARYNFPFGVPYLLVTNGLEHFCCVRDNKAGAWRFLDEIPDYSAVVLNCAL